MNNNQTDFSLPLVKISMVAVFFQLLVIPFSIWIGFSLGLPAKSALKAFEYMKESPFTGLIRDDTYNVVMVLLYLFSFPGLFFLLKDNHSTLTIFAVILTFTAVTLVLSSHSAFSMLYLSKHFWAETDDSVKKSLLAAGEAVLSQNLWNSSAGYFSGIFLQGAGIIISLAMIGSSHFSKLTIISGIIGNGLDLLQHLIHPFEENLSQMIMYAMGPFYIIWFLMLFLNLRAYVRNWDRRQKEND